MDHRALICVLVITATAAPAQATCVADDDGCTICCSGPDACSTSCPDPIRDWRRVGSSRLELAVGGVGSVDTATTDLGAGVRASFGYHRVREFDDRNIDDAHRPRGAWCAPLLLCGGGGITAMPISAVVGNERGVDVVFERTWIAGDAVTRISARPVFRVARESHFRTASFVGAIAPEVGVVVRGGTYDGVFLRWSPYPVDYRFTRRFAVSLTPVELAVAFGGDVAWTLSSSLALVGVL